MCTSAIQTSSAVPVSTKGGRISAKGNKVAEADASGRPAAANYWRANGEVYIRSVNGVH